MATHESSAPRAHPSTEEHGDTVEALYSGLERPTPVSRAGCSSATSTSTARSGKHLTAAATARIVGSPIQKR